MISTSANSDAIWRRMVRRLRREQQDKWKRVKWWLYNIGRHPKPFATHIPVLAGLPTLRVIRKVVEFGSGPYSTGAFLESCIYPDLEKLESFDDDPAWFDQVLAQNTGDPRLSLELVRGPVSSAVAGARLDDADLIFVDDSKTRAARAETIQAVCEKLPDSAYLVIHDFEIQEYQAASRSVAYRYVFTAFKPYVGVLWNSRHDHTPALKQLERRIRRKKREIQIDDIQAWHEYLGSNDHL